MLVDPNPMAWVHAQVLTGSFRPTSSGMSRDVETIIDLGVHRRQGAIAVVRIIEAGEIAVQTASMVAGGVGQGRRSVELLDTEVQVLAREMSTMRLPCRFQGESQETSRMFSSF